MPKAVDLLEQSRIVRNLVRCFLRCHDSRQLQVGLQPVHRLMQQTDVSLALDRRSDRFIDGISVNGVIGLRKWQQEIFQSPKSGNHLLVRRDHIDQLAILARLFAKGATAHRRAIQRDIDRSHDGFLHAVELCALQSQQVLAQEFCGAL